MKVGQNILTRAGPGIIFKIVKLPDGKIVYQVKKKTVLQYKPYVVVLVPESELKKLPRPFRRRDSVKVLKTNGVGKISERRIGPDGNICYMIRFSVKEFEYHTGDELKLVSRFKPKVKQADHWYFEGMDLYRLGYYRDAITCFNKVIRIYSKDTASWYKKGIILYELNNYKQAFKCFNRAIRINPKDAAIWYNIGNFMRLSGKCRESIKYYDKSIELDSNQPDVWVNKGISLNFINRHKEALDCYDQATKVEPSYAKGWLNKGHALGEMQKHKEAIECYKEAVRIWPKYHNAWLNMGCSFEELKKHKEAKRCYRRAETIKKEGAYDPTNDEIEKMCN